MSLKNEVKLMYLLFNYLNHHSLLIPLYHLEVVVVDLSLFVADCNFIKDACTLLSVQLAAEHTNKTIARL